LAGAIDQACADARGGTPLIVSHGTVLAAFAANLTGKPAFALWRSLDLPSWLALDLGGRSLVDSWRVNPSP
jgi:broad specificity phosphatase PhoE